MSEDNTHIEMKGAFITKVSTSQSETVQAKQFEGNTYFTSMEVSFGSGLDITDAKSINKVIQAATLANALCTANNRRNQWRDGLAPRVGTSATGYLEANAGNLGASNLYKAENIVDPKALGKFTSDLMIKLNTALGNVQAAEKLATPEPVQAPAEAVKPATDKPAEAAPAPTKRRVNPARTSTAATNQEVVS